MANQDLNLTRRDFLKLAGKTAVVSSGLMAGCAPLATNRSSASGAASAVDVHHHYFPAELIAEVKQHGKSLGVEYLPSKDGGHSLGFGKGSRTGVDPEIMDVDKRLEIMREGRVRNRYCRSATQRPGLPARWQTR